MKNLIKYELRKSFAPFLIVILINVLGLILNIFGVESNINKFVEFGTTIGSFIIILYSIKEFNDLYIEESDLLRESIPVKPSRLFLAKYIIFSLLYTVIVLLNTTAAIFKPQGIYDNLSNLVKNPELLIAYNTFGSILGFLSGITLAALCIVAMRLIFGENKETERFVGSILMFFVIFIAGSYIQPWSFDADSALKLIAIGERINEQIIMYFYFAFFKGMASIGGRVYRTINLPTVTLIINTLIIVFLTPAIAWLTDRK